MEDDKMNERVSDAIPSVELEMPARAIAASKRGLSPQDETIDRVWPSYVGQARKAILAQNWKSRQPYGLEEAISRFKRLLPGWWFTVGECSVSSDASCGPDRTGPDAHLLKLPFFDNGFHADLPQPSTLADALADVTAQAMEARQGGDSEAGSVHDSAAR